MITVGMDFTNRRKIELHFNFFPVFLKLDFKKSRVRVGSISLIEVRAPMWMSIWKSACIYLLSDDLVDRI
jgi:hypothetical protein